MCTKFAVHETLRFAATLVGLGHEVQEDQC